MSSATSFAVTSLQSPTIGTSALRFLPISAGSMSMCTIFASGANVASLPVTRSSKRAPTATSRSAFCIAVTAVYTPCIPGIPRHSSWASGNAPRAIRVVTTGRCPTVASSYSSSVASALITPPPT